MLPDKNRQRQSAHKGDLHYKLYVACAIHLSRKRHLTSFKEKSALLMYHLHRERAHGHLTRSEYDIKIDYALRRSPSAGKVADGDGLFHRWFHTCEHLWRGCSVRRVTSLAKTTTNNVLLSGTAQICANCQRIGRLWCEVLSFPSLMTTRPCEMTVMKSPVHACPQQRIPTTLFLMTFGNYWHALAIFRAPHRGYIYPCTVSITCTPLCSSESLK